jgi:formylmethanofuran dehydrogenase subunit E
MTELSLSLQEHLNRSAMLHSRLCPRQVLGVRMARLACTLLNIDPAVNRKAIYVYMEIGRCAADAVMVVTGASPTNGLMQLVNYGKVAATFVNRSSGEAIRVSERQRSREIAVQLMPELPSWEAQRDAYQIMRDDQLFNWQHVVLRESLPLIPEKHAVTCPNCGDRVNEFSEVVIDGKTLCKPCAFGAYFSPLEIIPQPACEQSADHRVYLHS